MFAQLFNLELWLFWYSTLSPPFLSSYFFFKSDNCTFQFWDTNMAVKCHKFKQIKNKIKGIWLDTPLNQYLCTFIYCFKRGKFHTPRTHNIVCETSPPANNYMQTRTYVWCSQLNVDFNTLTINRTSVTWKSLIVLTLLKYLTSANNSYSGENKELFGSSIWTKTKQSK